MSLLLYMLAWQLVLVIVGTVLGGLLLITLILLPVLLHKKWVSHLFSHPPIVIHYCLCHVFSRFTLTIIRLTLNLANYVIEKKTIMQKYRHREWCILLFYPVRSSKKSSKKNNKSDTEKSYNSHLPAKAPLVNNGLANGQAASVNGPANSLSAFANAGVPRIPRATSTNSWDSRTNLEMAPSNGRQNLIPMGKNPVSITLCVFYVQRGATWENSKGKLKKYKM